MRTIKAFGLAFVAVIALAAVSSASASAALFMATKTGKLTGKAIETQVFKTKGGTVECTKLTVSGEVVALTAETQEATVKYENCTAYGIFGAEISPAEYLFMSNGSVKILKTITITAPGCKITVPGGQEVSSVGYASFGKDIKLTPNVTNIASEGSGTTCTYGLEKEGTYKGTAEAGVEGGELYFE